MMHLSFVGAPIIARSKLYIQTGLNSVMSLNSASKLPPYNSMISKERDKSKLCILFALFRYFIKNAQEQKSR